MDPTKFDTFTKVLATSTSRRRALKSFVVATAGGFFGLGAIQKVSTVMAAPVTAVNQNSNTATSGSMSTVTGGNVSAQAPIIISSQPPSLQPSSSQPPSPCIGGTCGSFPGCHGNGNCACVQTPEGVGFCLGGNPICVSLQPCTSTSDCPPGFGCAINTCCGSQGVCVPPCPT